MKKGFTLIELLAVIVILAVIALISVPLILGVIEDSKVGAFKDSVSLTFSSAELYEAQNSISNDGIEVKDLVMKNNNFKYGKIVKNANNELEAVNVSDGRYCAWGLLTNITIYKGECDVTTPLAPTVSVEDSVYGTTKEYTLSAPSTMSGIDSYEYYLSDTTDTPSSDVVISGSSKTNKIAINKVSKYVFFRVVSVANLKGDWTSAKINYVDLTSPLASLTSNTITSKSVTLAAICSDNESEITKYEFSKDGVNYVDNNTNSAYTFNDLTSGTATYYVKCTNGANDKTTASVEATTVTIDTPTYSINPTGYATSKTLTVTYPSGYTNEYSLDGGTSWITYTAPVVFNANGNLIARVNDGTNYVTGSSYTVTNIDTTIPTVTTSVSGKVGTLTLGDNLELSGYTVTTTSSVPTVWTAITGTTGIQTYTASTAGTYYAWVKDAAGNTNNKTFVIDTSAFELVLTLSSTNFNFYKKYCTLYSVPGISNSSNNSLNLWISKTASSYSSVVAGYTSNTKLNFTDYKYIDITYNTSSYVEKGTMNVTYTPTLQSTAIGDAISYEAPIPGTNILTLPSSTTSVTKTINISTISGDYYLLISNYISNTNSNSGAQSISVTKIRFYN